MRRISVFLLCVLCGLLAALPTTAQSTPQNSHKDPISFWLRNSFFLTQVYLSRAAEKMPEEYYGMRPGTQTEVRTFGQIIGHLANYNFMECSDAKGEKNPNQGNDFEKVTEKAALVKGLNNALTYCASVYAALTDASAAEMIPVTSQNGGQAQALRVGRLIFNYGHNYEHYGNIVTYMRMKGIVPPSSEPSTH
jgi:hypothetical protein